MSFYRRRAASYRFVRVLLEETFGAPALREMHRPRPQGRASESLATELEEMEAVFEGAEVQSRVDLALRPEPPASGRDPEVARTAFKRYQRGAAEDPDLAEDCRMMVPVAFDEERQRFKCWAVFGWSARTVRIAFATRPTLTIKKKGLFRSKPKVIWGSTSRRAPVPAMAEIWVREPLDRDEFRAICDEHRTVPAIRAALDRGSDGG
ncbi:MAG: hypothetical protein R3F20_02095 [Planctomycetota bacterium]